MLLVSWNVLCQLAPWLLLGMLFSGMLHVLLPAGFIRRKFQGFSGIVKSVLLGVPLPLCSCGVVPAGIGLKNQGASNGAAVGFLISTPQTGIDSILISASFFGWPFALFKMVTAAITGVIGGWLTDRIEPVRPRASSELNVISDDPVATSCDGNAAANSDQPAWWRIWIHGVEIVRSIWGWLLLGVFISAAIETYIPADRFESVGQLGLWPAMLLVLLISVPLYVCATASVPIAAALVTSGLPPAAALVFLMAGPATNATTIGAIHGRFGWKTTLVYLATIILGSMLFAWLFDWLLTANVSSVASHQHDHENWWSLASGIILLAMIVFFAISDFRRWLGRRFKPDPSLPKTEISIQGMTCGACVSRLESAIKNSRGVDSVQVELKSGIATIFGDPQIDEIKQLIQRLGFRVNPAEPA